MIHAKMHSCQTKLKIIASKDAPHKANGSSFKQNTFGGVQECQTLHIAWNLAF